MTPHPTFTEVHQRAIVAGWMAELKVVITWKRVWFPSGNWFKGFMMFSDYTWGMLMRSGYEVLQPENGFFSAWNATATALFETQVEDNMIQSGWP